MKVKTFLSIIFSAGVFAACFLGSVSAAPVTTTLSTTTLSKMDSIIGSNGFAVVANAHSDGVYLYTCTSIDCATFTSQKIYNSTGITDVLIEMGTDNLPRIAFYNYTAGNLYQMKCDDATCTSNTVTSMLVGATFELEEMAMFSDNTMAVLFARPGVVSQRDLRYVHCTDVDCTSVVQNTIFQSVSGFNNYYLSQQADIEVASDDTVHISYALGKPHRLYHATCTTNTCATVNATLLKDEVLPTNDQDKGYLDMELTRGDVPRIAYYQYLSSDEDDFYSGVPHIYMDFCSDTNCTATTSKNIENNWYTGDYVSMELNSQDYPVLVYGHLWNGNKTGQTGNYSSIGTQLTECMDELCETMERKFLVDPQTINDLGDRGMYWVNLVLNKNDDILVPQIYRVNKDAETRRLQITYEQRREETYPRKEMIFSQATYRNALGREQGRIGEGIQVEKGTDGFARIAYYDYWMDTVRFVRCKNIECTDRFQTIVDGTGDSVNFAAPFFGGYLDIKIGTDGLPRILYTAGGDGQAMYLATCTTQDCINPTIRLLENDTISYKYRSVDLELDASNIPHVVFSRILTPVVYPYTVREYKGQCSDAACTTFTSTQLDTGLMIGGSTGTAFSPANEFMFLNYDFATGLELWRCTDATCSTRVETNIAPAFAGTWDYRASSIKFGTDNLPRIAYLDTNDYTTHFLNCADLDCTTHVDATLPLRQDADFLQMELNDNNLARFASVTYPAPDYNASLEYVSCDDEDCATMDHQIIYDGLAEGIEYSYWTDLTILDNDKPFIVSTNPSHSIGSTATVFFPEAITCKDYRCRTESGPTIPTSLFSNNTQAQTGQTNPNLLTSLDVLFSALFKVLDTGDLASAFRLQISTDDSFRTLAYDSGKTPLGVNSAMDARSEDITIPGGTVTYGTTYHWRIKFWDDNDVQGLYSNVFPAANTFLAPTPPNPVVANFAPTTITTNPTPLTFDVTRATYGVDLDNLKLDIDGTVIYENSTCEPDYTCDFDPIADGYTVTITPDNSWVDGTYDFNTEYRITNADPYQNISTDSFSVAIPVVATAPTTVNGGGGGGGYNSSYTITAPTEDSQESLPRPSAEDIVPSPVVVSPEAQEIADRLIPETEVALAPSMQLLERVFTTNFTSDSPMASGDTSVGASLCTELTSKLSALPMDPSDSDYRKLLREYGLVLGLGSSDNQHLLISRSEILRLVLQADCKSFTIPSVVDKSFPDVEVTHKDALYIQIAKIQDIVSGYLHDGTYKPDNQISRAEALKVVLEVVLGRMGHKLTGLGKIDISDVSRDAWYYRYVDYAAERGIVGKDAFRPNDKATREDVAGFLLRTLQVAGK